MVPFSAGTLGVGRSGELMGPSLGGSAVERPDRWPGSLRRTNWSWSTGGQPRTIGRMSAVAMLIGYLIAYGSVILFVLWLIALLTGSDGESSQHR